MTYYTRGMIGDGSVPDAHLSTTPVQTDVGGDDMPLPEMGERAPMAEHAWRARQWAGNPAGPPVDAENPSLVHTHQGRPDSRRQPTSPQPAGYPNPAQEGMRASPEMIDNSRLPTVINPVAAPVVPKAGSTGADPARTAEAARWMSNRPYGVWVADHPVGIVKIEQLSPRAAAQYAQPGPTAHLTPNPGGTGITVNTANLGPTPNTQRPIPRPWDELLAVGDQPSTTGAVRRSRRYGL